MMRRTANASNNTRGATTTPDVPLGTPSKTPPSKKRDRKDVSNLLFLVVATFILMMLLLTAVFYLTLASPATTTTTPATTTTSGIDATGMQKETPIIPQDHQDAASAMAPLTAQFRQEFVERYGPDAMSWFKSGIRPIGNLDVTAQRLLSASDNNKFVMAFAGYSVTVGRGNYFTESFPFVLEKLLKPILKDLLSLDLEVRNAAIGGIPSFPYAFCTEHFLGADADVISWDYSMNEGNGASVMESYIRLSQKALSAKQPMMIVLDKNRERRKLLEEYATLGVLHDGVMMSRASEIIPKKILENEDDSGKPAGLQKWNEFGAPEGCPGKSSWHPKRAEHEFLGYMLAMHFVEAIERALAMKHQGIKPESHLTTPTLPKPLHDPAENPKAVTQLLYGHDDGSGNHELHDLSCRTSFLPAQDHDKILPSVVVNGLVQSKEFDDIMLDRPDSLYSEGWVLDVSKIERDTKKKVNRCGGLGYIDMKIALYGIPESGPLRLWLPYEGKLEMTTDDTAAATKWFDDLILCEANEKRDDKACRLDRDLQITVGGSKVASSPSMMNGAGVYLNRQTCLHVEIPDDAKVTRLADLKTSSDGDEPLDASEKERLSQNPDAIGLVVDLNAGPSVTRGNGACCVSHIVWEQH